MYGIWNEKDTDWVRELPAAVNGNGKAAAILAFESKKVACKRAATVFGRESYTAAKHKGLCEVLPLLPVAVETPT